MKVEITSKEAVISKNLDFVSVIMIIVIVMTVIMVMDNGDKNFVNKTIQCCHG